MGYLAQVAIEIEKILDELSEPEKEFVLKYLFQKFQFDNLKKEKDENRKEKSVQKG